MIGRNELDAVTAAAALDFKTLKTIVAELPEDRLRDFIRALERTHGEAVENLERRHGGAPYSGMGGLLGHEVEDDD